MISQHGGYGVGTTVSLSPENALARVKVALAAEGFGVLCEIDVAATLKKKLGVEFRPYIILGACNPALAHQALIADRDIGLLLPCNVIVYSDDEPGHSVVAAIDPAVALDMTGNASLHDLATEARARLTRALEAVAANQ